MKNELDVVRDVSQKFQQLGIPFMLTGSMAMNYYAEPRMTRDIDLVVELDASGLSRMIELFESEYYVSREAASRAVSRGSMFNLIHEESVIKVDCIMRRKDAFRELEFRRRKEVQISDFTTWIVSKEDLILSKLVWAKASRSALQIGDVRNLLSTGYDQDYLASWSSVLSVAELLRECSSG